MKEHTPTQEDRHDNTLIRYGVRPSEHPQITHPGPLISNPNGTLRHITETEIKDGTVKP